LIDPDVKLIASALQHLATVLESDEEAGRTLKPANIVDGLFLCGRALHALSKSVADLSRTLRRSPAES
jgi:hypothetical protein